MNNIDLFECEMFAFPRFSTHIYPLFLLSSFIDVFSLTELFAQAHDVEAMPNATTILQLQLCCVWI